MVVVAAVGGDAAERVGKMKKGSAVNGHAPGVDEGGGAPASPPASPPRVSYAAAAKKASSPGAPAVPASTGPDRLLINVDR